MTYFIRSGASHSSNKTLGPHRTSFRGTEKKSTSSIRRKNFALTSSERFALYGRVAITRRPANTTASAPLLRKRLSPSAAGPREN